MNSEFGKYATNVLVNSLMKNIDMTGYSLEFIEKKLGFPAGTIIVWRNKFRSPKASDLFRVTLFLGPEVYFDTQALFLSLLSQQNMLPLKMNSSVCALEDNRLVA